MKRRLLLAFAVLAAAMLPVANAHALLDEQTCGALDSVPVVGDVLRAADETASTVEVCDRTPEPDPPDPPDPEPDPPVTREPKTDASGRDAAITGGVTLPVQPAAAPVAQSRPEPGEGGAVRTAGEPAPARFGDTIPAGASGADLALMGVAALLALVAGLVIGRRRASDAAERRADLTIGGALGSLPEAIIWAGADGRIRSINPAAEAMLEMTAHAARGRTLWGVIDGALDDGSTLARWIRRAEPPASATGTAGRSGIPVAVTLAPAGDDGTVLVARDLRPERQLSHMKEAFLSNVGHELRTPLTSALGFARMMRRRALTPEQTNGFLDAIVNACERLDHVIDLLIDVTALDGGRLTVDDTPVELEPMLAEIADEARARHRAHVFSVDVAASAAVRGSDGLLRQAVNELVENAVKFSPDGGLVTLAASTTGRGDARTVTLRVSDQGVGMPAGRLEQMMDDFEQGDPSATRSFGGLGIGLGFVRRVVNAHAGSVHIASEPGDGTTVRLSLPAAVRPPARGRSIRVMRPRPALRSSADAPRS